MQYPLISEYVNSILNAEDNFATQTELRPVLNDDGTPVMSSGNFAVVFKMKDERDGKLYAVKCFTREQEGRAENYRMIVEELEKVSSPYITPIKWLDGELFVDTKQTDETEFPVLLMDWIEGPTLSAFLQSIADQLAEGKVFKDNEYEMFELRCLPANFLRMASWLLKQPFAHGDLKPDNIIVQEDGYCVLVDYDGMYVPAMQGMPLTCMGTPNFTHPSQTNNTLNKDIDNYAIPVIALSLQVFALKPSMIAESPDCCVITKQQALKLHTLNLLNDEELMANNNIQSLLSLFLYTLSQNKLDVTCFDQIIAEILIPKDFDIYNTEVKDEDLENCYTDRYGVRYSIDGRRALKRSSDISSIDYSIREGTYVLCDSSFQSCNLHRIHLPESVLSIGKVAFANNYYMTHCNIPQSVINICNNNPWGGCFNIKHFKCESPHFIVEDGILYSANYLTAYGFIYWREDVRINKKTRILASNAFWSNKSNLFIKSVDVSNVHKIGYAAFLGCESIEEIDISSANDVGDNAFNGCSKLKSIILSQNLEKIGENVFNGCLIPFISIPPSVKTIESFAFSGSGIESVTIPESVNMIDRSAFFFCDKLRSVTIQRPSVDDLVEIFSVCDNLMEITVQGGNPRYSSIDGVLFNATKNKILFFPPNKTTSSYEIPSTVTHIEDHPFFDSEYLQSITIPSSVTQISDGAFYCEYLKEIKVVEDNLFYSSQDGVLFNKNKTELLVFPRCNHTSWYKIPSTVACIREGAFNCCESLHVLSIPSSVIRIETSAFANCKSLESIIIPPSVTIIKNRTFYHCESLSSVIIPSSIKEIEQYAFAYCKSLKSITILSSEISIDIHAFKDCDSIEVINIPQGEIQRFKSILPAEFHNLIVEQ